MEEIRAGSIAASVQLRAGPVARRRFPMRPIILPIVVILLVALLGAAGVFWLGEDEPHLEQAVPSSAASQEDGAAHSRPASPSPLDASEQSPGAASFEQEILVPAATTQAAEGVGEDGAADTASRSRDTAASASRSLRGAIGDERLIKLANERAKKEATRIAQALEMGAHDEETLAEILRKEAEQLREGLARLGQEGSDGTRSAVEVRDEVVAWKKTELELAFGASLAEKVLTQSTRVPARGAESQGSKRPGSASPLRRGGDGRGGQ